MDCFGTGAPRNDVLGYTARVLALALDNRRCHARSAMTCNSLRLPITLHRVHAEALHEVVVLRDFGFGEVQVHLHALVEQFRRLGGIAEEQLAHHAVGGLIRPFGSRLTLAYTVH